MNRRRLSLLNTVLSIATRLLAPLRSLGIVRSGYKRGRRGPRQGSQARSRARSQSPDSDRAGPPVRGVPSLRLGLWRLLVTGLTVTFGSVPGPGGQPERQRGQGGIVPVGAVTLGPKSESSSC